MSKLIVILNDGAEYAPKSIWFHRVLFWNYAVFDGGLMHVSVNNIKRIEYRP
jgi:hypothetical protein